MSTEKPKTFKTKLKQFWLNYETKIVLMVGFILVATIAFEAGVLKGQNWQATPLIIEKPAEISENSANAAQKAENQAISPSVAQNTPSQTPNLALEGQNQTQAVNIPPQTCAFVGSKNSTKFHKPDCRFAKNIKPENKVCFGSEEEAKNKGYSPCSGCMK